MKSKYTYNILSTFRLSMVVLHAVWISWIYHLYGKYPPCLSHFCTHTLVNTLTTTLNRKLYIYIHVLSLRIHELYLFPFILSRRLFSPQCTALLDNQINAPPINTSHSAYPFHQEKVSLDFLLVENWIPDHSLNRF